MDVRRVRDYWGGWELLVPENLRRSELVLTGVPIGTVGHYRWKDFAWAEQVHQMGWYWYSSPEFTWYLYHIETVTEQIGVHFYTIDRTWSRAVDRTQYPGIGDGLHLICGMTYSVPFEQWGPSRCSNTTELQ